MIVCLLAIIAVCQVWQVLGPRTVQYLRSRRHQQQAAAVPAQPIDACAQLLLYARKGAVPEHEVAFHGTDLPTTYSYAGKVYVRMRRLGAHAWEFRR